MTAASRSVQSPATAEDLFAQLDNFKQARETLESLGLLSPDVAASLDTLESAIASHLATVVKFDPGAKVRLVSHDGSIYAYDERDGKPSFEAVEPVPAGEITLATDANPPAGPATPPEAP